MSQHKAASIESVGKPAEVVSVESKSPSAGEILIKNHAIAINPVDYYIRDQGAFAKSWPMIVGSDTAGEVFEVGPDVTSHKKGDRVLLATTYLMTGNSAEAGFQEYSLAPSVAATKIPDSMSYEDAVVVPLSAATSAAGLYSKKFLGLDLPSTNPKPNGKKLLVWGASSSVASSAIQLAVASGYEVITTASKKNFEHAKNLGASKVFDYNSPSIVGDLTEELQNGTCVGAYDAIAKEDTQLAIGTVLAQLGGGTIASVLPPSKNVPASVKSEMVFAISIFGPEKDIGQAVFQEFLPKALASGQFKPQPKPEVFGKGLESLQGAMNKHQAGVSAKKIIVTL